GRRPRPVRIPAPALRMAGLLGDALDALGLAHDAPTSGKMREILQADWSARLPAPPGPRPRVALPGGFADAVSAYRAEGLLPRRRPNPGDREHRGPRLR
ncbi:MAG: hypothetical protein AAF763_05480, partial [Pseudomonadota bacterium]